MKKIDTTSTFCSCNHFVCLCHLLQVAKMANYAKFQRLCNLLFVMFAMVFVSSRLGVYPVW